MANDFQFNFHSFIDEDYFSIDLDNINNNEAVHRCQTPNRFSFSVPEYVLTPESPSPPPSSVINSPDFSPRPSLLIPTEFDNDVILDTFELESNPPTPNAIQLALDYPKELLLITSENDKQMYRKPSKASHDARKVWKYAKIPSAATIREIEYRLLDWAFTYAKLDISEKKIKNITWRTESKCVCSCQWSTFLRWITCASLSMQ